MSETNATLNCQQSVDAALDFARRHPESLELFFANVKALDAKIPWSLKPPKKRSKKKVQHDDLTGHYATGEVVSDDEDLSAMLEDSRELF